MKITVIETLKWIYSETNMGAGGLIAQVTICDYNGTRFFVRENTNGVDSFQISSGERWGDKVGGRPRAARQILELCAPDQHWNEIAEAVRQSDALKRQVKKNKNFTAKWVNNLKTKP